MCTDSPVIWVNFINTLLSLINVDRGFSVRSKDQISSICFWRPDDRYQLCKSCNSENVDWNMQSQTDMPLPLCQISTYSVKKWAHIILKMHYFLTDPHSFVVRPRWERLKFVFCYPKTDYLGCQFLSPSIWISPNQ